MTHLVKPSWPRADEAKNQHSYTLSEPWSTPPRHCCWFPLVSADPDSASHPRPDRTPQPPQDAEVRVGSLSRHHGQSPAQLVSISSATPSTTCTSARDTTFCLMTAAQGQREQACGQSVGGQTKMKRGIRPTMVPVTYDCVAKPRCQPRSPPLLLSSSLSFGPTQRLHVLH